MISKVEITNRPYENRLKILINGNPPSAFSPLDKFLTEPFIYWCGRIFPELEKELNGGNYIIYFESRIEEIKVLEKIAENYRSCTQFVSKEILRNTPITGRMASLSSFLKNNQITQFKHTTKKALFILPDNQKQLHSEIRQLHVENRFCKVESSSIDFSSCVHGVPDADLYFLVCNKDREKEYIHKRLIPSGFIVLLSDHTGFEGMESNCFVYSTTAAGFFDTVFECFILGPLPEIFINCIFSIPEKVRLCYLNELQDLQSSSFRILVKPESTTIEKGTSVPIRFQSDLSGYAVQNKDLDFSYSEKGIISTNGMRVVGLRAGNSILYVYQKGEKDPCASVQFDVIERNRVVSLEIEEQSLMLGEGDRISLTWKYNPPDADNLSKIQWSSDDQSVIKVDDRGGIHAVGAGTAFIRLTCERVSSKTVVHVLPHIRDIHLEQEEIVMFPGQSLEIKARSVPEITIEGGLKMAVLDSSIANAVSGKIDAFAIGDTVLVIQDKKNRLRKDIPIHVVSEKNFYKHRTQPEKKGLLSRIFG